MLVAFVPCNVVDAACAATITVDIPTNLEHHGGRNQIVLLADPVFLCLALLVDSDFPLLLDMYSQLWISFAAVGRLPNLVLLRPLPLCLPASTIIATSASPQSSFTHALSFSLFRSPPSTAIAGDLAHPAPCLAGLLPADHNLFPRFSVFRFCFCLLLHVSS